MNSDYRAKAVLTIVTSQNHDHVLLVKRKDVGVWVLPGGGVDPGETSLEAAIRELYEETGMKQLSLQEVAQFVPNNKITLPTSLFLLSLPYDMLTTFPFQDLSNESTEIAVFSKNNVPKMIFPIHQIWIEEILNLDQSEKRAYPIRRTLKEVSYLWLFKTIIRHPICSFGYLFSRIRIWFEKKL